MILRILKKSQVAWPTLSHTSHKEGLCTVLRKSHWTQPCFIVPGPLRTASDRADTLGCP